jgi:hypothetical protein
MSHGEAPFGDQLLNVLGELQQPQQVGYRAAILTCPAGNLIVAQTVVVDEPLKRRGYFNGIQVFPLNVLDEGDLDQAVIRNILNQDGDGPKPSDFCGAPPTLSGHEFETATSPANQQGLDNATGANRVG